MRPRLVARIAAVMLLAALLSGCVRTMYALEAPPPPTPGYIPSYRLREVQQGHTEGHVRSTFGAPLDVAQEDGAEVWHYRVHTMRCAKITTNIFGSTRRTPPPDYPDARIVFRDGVVHDIRGITITTTGARQ